MAVPKGVRIGGRQKGSKNRIDRGKAHQSSHIVALASDRIRQILEGKLPCSVCRGKGKTQFQPRSQDGKIGIRPCQSCWGAKFEQLSPELISRTALEIRGEAYPKLKAIEHTGADGGPIQASVTVRFMKSPHANATD